MARHTPPTPQDYQLIFEHNPVGAAILEDLVRRFAARNPYVRGGHEADRQTAFNAGQQEVVQFILRRINQANGVDDENELSADDPDE